MLLEIKQKLGKNTQKNVGNRVLSNFATIQKIFPHVKSNNSPVDRKQLASSRNSRRVKLKGSMNFKANALTLFSVPRE